MNQEPTTGALGYLSQGDAVVAVQLALRRRGFLLTPDGRFGPMTREAVKTFRHQQRLPAGDMVDEAAWAALSAP